MLCRTARWRRLEVAHHCEGEGNSLADERPKHGIVQRVTNGRVGKVEHVKGGAGSVAQSRHHVAVVEAAWKAALTVLGQNMTAAGKDLGLANV